MVNLDALSKAVIAGDSDTASKLTKKALAAKVAAVLVGKS